MKSRILSLLFVISPLILHAQNWALINPAYKYNYSLGGTDTITNQIFATHVDTLGVDSFRYELNRIAIICDTCAPPGNGIHMWPNAPQWPGGAVSVSNDIWHFHEGNSKVIMPLAATGTSWLYDTLNAVTATMQGIVMSTTFGQPDEQRTIILSTGDSLVLSRDHGILSWNTGHELIGINGPDIGITIPGLTEFFPYSAGDVLEYSSRSSEINANAGFDGRSRHLKFTVDQGTVLDSAIAFDGNMVAVTIPIWNNNFGNGTYENGPANWYAGIPELPWAQLVFSYPGQLVRSMNRVYPYVGGTLYCIAEHGIDSAGYYSIGCRSIDLNNPDIYGKYLIYGETTGPFGTEVYGDEGNCPSPSIEFCGVQYLESVGLIEFNGYYFESSESYVLQGASIGGDTIGTLTPDGVILSVSDERQVNGPMIYPNPANALIQVNDPLEKSSKLMIMDASGKSTEIHSSPSNSSTLMIDVSHLSPGLYMLIIQGLQPQRFMIAR